MASVEAVQERLFCVVEAGVEAKPTGAASKVPMVIAALAAELSEFTLAITSYSAAVLAVRPVFL